MSRFASPRFLPRVMWADAASCAATGTMQLALVGPLAAWTGLPTPLLVDTGVFLLVYALAAAWMASRPQPPRVLIGLVAVGNLGWALACGALLASGWVSPTGMGQAWIAAQVLVVLVLADLQWAGLRATRGLSPAVAAAGLAGLRR